MFALTLLTAFGLELVTLFAFGSWVVHFGQNTLAQLLFGVGAPLLTAVFWGTFLSPKAAVKPSPLLQLILKLAVFALATAALITTGRFVSGIVFGVLAVAVTIGLAASSTVAKKFYNLQHP